MNMPMRGASLVAQLVESACDVEDPSSIPGSGRSPGDETGYSLQPSCLENPHGQRSLVGYSPWGRKESDTIERLSTARHAKETYFTVANSAPLR